jgi:hypothetical protein
MIATAVTPAADPSFGNRAGINYAKQTGRCVERILNATALVWLHVDPRLV